MVTLSSQPVTTLAAYSGSAPEIQQGWNVMGVPVMQSGRAFTGQRFEFAYRYLRRRRLSNSNMVSAA